MFRFFRSASGFTLVELLLVFALVVVLVGITATFTNQAIHGQEFERATELVRSELIRARTDTVAGTNDASWGVAFFPQAITRFQGASYAGRNPTFDLTTTFASTITISGLPEIVFTRPDGIPQTAGVITITANGRVATVIVNAYGVVEVQ